MSTVPTAPRLSLFQIESELLQLIDQREDAMERLAVFTPQYLDFSGEQGHYQDAINIRDTIQQELFVVEGLIRDYLKREVRKVDSIAFAVKEYEARAEARKAEAERMRASADRDAETANRIKAMVLEVMQEFGEKKLPGRLFIITRQGNGGVQALKIGDRALIPLELQRCTVELVASAAHDFAEKFAGRYRILESAHPDSKDIREALERGEGVMGCRLEPRGEHVRIK